MKTEEKQKSEKRKGKFREKLDRKKRTYYSKKAGGGIRSVIGSRSDQNIS